MAIVINLADGQFIVVKHKLPKIHKENSLPFLLDQLVVNNLFSLFVHIVPKGVLGAVR